ncbi:hypothetical protein J7369_14295 [Xanthomonas phaseoli pv. dieffenbachiae]|uniref:hypothetical protein n=1 Tax=Xanthomonas TaxID=338 RepID=UPI001ADCB001|nr:MULTISPECIES: hypothetical protein [Xanthomonas]MBO9898857.1 hypothetical protein [Xanthomonas phaseoli pv. dieffenbachiae]MCC8612779.1 hypothetical protein [Xanthomonas euvesicatoria pv. euvesicatoria]CAD7740088.1 hypothetical protein LMG31884_46230 [Xanthomonas hydrangeae]CAD7740092.1 hypothetical protein LMG31884_46230 [Xanthomonas hydrangeae]
MSKATRALPRYPQALSQALANPARRRDMEFALGLADELTPCPARAHTALLILRQFLAEFAGTAPEDLIRSFQSQPGAAATKKRNEATTTYAN